MDASRAEALKLASAAKASSAQAAEARIRAANDEIGAKIAAAEERIRAATDAALGDIESVAAEAAQDMVRLLAGVSVSSAEAARAAKAAMAHG
jgi:F-type H+-transporting ATPase subunit b